MANGLGGNGVTDRFGGGGGGMSGGYNEAGYVDIGPTRWAWGTADASAVDTKVVSFPTAFAAPPSLHITKVGGVGVEVVPRYVTASEFAIGAYGDLRNPVPYSWLAIGMAPTVIVPPESFDIEGLPVWSAAVRALKAGTRDARILCIGDSTTAGYGANGTAMANNDIAASYPTQLANLLTARGLQGCWENFVGLHNSPNMSTFDLRWTFPDGGWGGGIGTLPWATLGAWALTTTGAANARASFKPTVDVDTFEIFMIARQTTGTPTFVLAVDGVDKSTVSLLADNVNPGKIVKTVVKVPLGQHTLSVKPGDTSIVAFCGIVAYNSGVRHVDVLNAGWSSGRSGDLTMFNGAPLTQSWSPLNILPLYNPDLVLLNLMINEFNGATPTGKDAYMSQMQSIIDASRNSGADVVLILCNRIGTTYDSNWPLFAGYVQELATRNRLKVVDLTQKLGPYATAVANGDMRDQLHMNSQGYGKIATHVCDTIYPAA